jgi:hypothetical protein
MVDDVGAAVTWYTNHLERTKPHPRNARKHSAA